jgi:CheY-like chemotaxis protein
VSAAPIRTLVVDDEPLARRGIRARLAHVEGFDVVGECDSGPAAVEAIRQLAPDLVFLDVQMPGLDGFGVVQQVGAERMPMVVFVTAYDAHALRAFEVHALDYLLKPLGARRFRAAFRRARAQHDRARSAEAAERLRALLAHVAAEGTLGGDPAPGTFSSAASAAAAGGGGPTSGSLAAVSCAKTGRQALPRESSSSSSCAAARSARIVTGTGPTPSSSTTRVVRPASGTSPVAARTCAVPTVGCPANGISPPGVKMRTQRVCCAATGGRTKVVSE